MMRRVFISGISGFVGSYLAELMLSKGWEVHGSIRVRSRMDNILHIKDKLKLHVMDLGDTSNVMQVIEEVKPDWIFHLAAQSFVPDSWVQPEQTYNINTLGTVRVLEAVRKYCPTARVLIIGSSEEYGDVKDTEVPITEENPLRPLSPYGISKVASDLCGKMYYHSYKLHVVITRAFNHEGPRRGEQFSISNWCKQVALIEKDKDWVIHVGNLNSYRDFTDVRDVVNAYYLALEKCKPGQQYNISSGTMMKMSDVLEMILDLSPIGSKIRIKQDKDRMRPSDVVLLQGDSTKFRKATGWSNKIPLTQTVADLLNYWRKRV